MRAAQCRMELVNYFRRRPDPEVLAVQKISPSNYSVHMQAARFCPVCGGYAQWTPRLTEALFYGCVPVILSEHLEV